MLAVRREHGSADCRRRNDMGWGTRAGARGTVRVTRTVLDPRLLPMRRTCSACKLANANSVELRGLDEADSKSTEGVIVDMRRYLVAQREIFDRTA